MHIIQANISALFHTVLGNGMVQSHLIEGSMIPLSSCGYFVDWNMILECLVPFVRVAIRKEFVLSKDSQLSGMVLQSQGVLLVNLGVTGTLYVTNFRLIFLVNFY